MADPFNRGTQTAPAGGAQRAVPVPSRGNRTPWLIGLACFAVLAIGAGVLIWQVAGGSGEGNDAANHAMARQLWSDFSSARHCYDEPDGVDCTVAVEHEGTGITDICWYVGSDGVLDTQLDESLRGADPDLFTGLCDRWQVVQTMPRFQGEPELTRMMQDAGKIRDRYE